MNHNPQAITVLERPNPFEAKVIRHELACVPKTPLERYLAGVSGPLERKVIFLDGRLIDPERITIEIPGPGSQIVVAEDLGGGGGSKGLLRSLAMLAILAIAIAAAFVLGPGSSNLALGIVSHGWALAIGAAISIGGALMVNALIPPPGMAKQLSTYSWSGPAMTAQEGLGIPVRFGQNMVGPNVIESFVQSTLTTEYLNILCDFGFGVASSITQIEINGNPLSDYPGVWVDTRMGYNDQAPMEYFSEIVNTYPQETRLIGGSGDKWGTSAYPQSQAAIIIGTGAETQAVEFEFTFPKGIWAGPNSDGSYDSWTVHLGVAYRKVGELDWTTVLLPRTTAGLPLNAQGQAPYWLAVTSQWSPNDAGTQYVLAVDYGADDHKVGDKYTGTIQAPTYDPSGNTSGSEKVTVTGTWVINPLGPGASFTSQPGTNYVTITDFTYISRTCTWNQQQLCRDVIRIDNLPSGQYEYMVAKLGANHDIYTVPDTDLTENTSRRGEETWLTSIREIQYAQLTYPNKILLGIRALATDKLNGSGLNITAVVNMAPSSAMGYKNQIANDQPAAYYRMGDAIGSAACVDATGLGCDGVYHGAPTLGQPGLVLASPNKAAHLAATDSVTIAAPAKLPGQAWAVEFWCKLAALPSATVPVLSAADGSVYVGINAEGNIVYSQADIPASIGDPGGGGTITPEIPPINVQSTAALSLRVAHHVAVSVGPGGFLFMVDGVPQFVAVSPAGWSPAIIGGGFAGVLDEVALYAYGIQPGCLRQHYITGTTAIQSSMEDRRADNPAMAAMDVLCNPLYGAQQSPALLDMDFLEDYADFCDELVPDGEGGQVYRHIFNGTFEKQESVWAALGRLGAATQTVFFRTGTQYSGVCDKPATRSQLFTMGNIKRDSFKQSWPGLMDRANSISGEFLDETNNYKKTPLRVMNEAVIAAGQPLQDSGSVDLFGITNPRNAWRALMYRLLATQAGFPTVTIDVALEGMAVKLGDVVGLQHDVPEWGAGGRILAALSATRFRLDQKVTIEAGNNYVLMVVIPSVERAAGVITSVLGNTITVATAWDGSTNVSRLLVNGFDLPISSASVAGGVAILEVSSDCTQAWSAPLGMASQLYDTDVIETATVTNGAGTTDTVNIAAPFTSVPDIYSTYFFGQLSDVQDYRVTAIGRGSDQDMSLQLTAYNPDLYGDLEPVLPTAPVAANAIAVSNLAVAEAPTSTPQFPYASLKWTPGVATTGARVYATHDGLPEFLAADVSGSNAVVAVTAGVAWTFRVVGYNARYQAAPYSTAPTCTLTAVGVSVLPQNVAGFGFTACTVASGSAAASTTLKWTANPSTDNVDHYEIRYGGSCINPQWAFCEALTPNPAASATSATFASGPGSYLICAVNAAGLYSAVPTTCLAIASNGSGGTSTGGTGSGGGGTGSGGGTNGGFGGGGTGGGGGLTG